MSAIVLWEFARLVQQQKIALDLDGVQVVRILNQVQVWPIDLAVARASTHLDSEGIPLTS